VLAACSESSTGTGGGGGAGGVTADTLVRLTDALYNRNHPCWNSTGTEIYFTKYVVIQPGNILTSNIWSMPAAGGQETQRTFFTGLTDFPSVKPALLAFRSDHDGYFDIYTSNGGLLNVTDTEAKDFEVAVTPLDSPGKLALSKADSLSGGVVWNIYTLESTGLEKVSTGNKDFHPTFSDMGNHIAFQRTHSEFDGAQIIVIPRNGGPEVEVTPYGQSCHHPDWNRAYDKIAFCRGGKVYMREPDGSNEKQLTFETQFAQYPAWSPNGQKLAYVDFTEGHYVIFVKDVKHILTAP
jgi:Tol biopolymer transport system component